jgi:hypothetical protein
MGPRCGRCSGKAKFWNLAVALLSVVLLSTLVGYFFLENFTYRP